MIKLTLPPVVSKGQYQMMESKMATVEQMAMTDRAIIGPQWQSLFTSWRFSNLMTANRKLIFLPLVVHAPVRAEQSLGYQKVKLASTPGKWGSPTEAMRTMEVADSVFSIYGTSGETEHHRSLECSLSQSPLLCHGDASFFSAFQSTLSSWERSCLHLESKSQKYMLETYQLAIKIMLVIAVVIQWLLQIQQILFLNMLLIISLKKSRLITRVGKLW